MCQTRPMRWGWALGLVLLGATACGGDDPASWPLERPRIDEVSFVGQSPRDPLGLQFMLQFVDGDGTLGTGRLELTIGNSAAGQIGLAELLAAQRPVVPPDATSGEIEVLVRLERAPTGDEQLTIGFELVDAEGNRSNRPTITMAAQ